MQYLFLPPGGNKRDIITVGFLSENMYCQGTALYIAACQEPRMKNKGVKSYFSQFNLPFNRSGYIVFFICHIGFKAH
jgi:hypothetical protein